VVRICAALAWYDEPDGFLTRCIRSLRGVVDELVALDGRWEEHPGEGFWSSPENLAEVNSASLAAGISTVPMRPARPYVSQLEKRQDLMRFASANADWILVIDADEYVVSANPLLLRAALAQTPLEVGYVGFRNLNRGEIMPGIPLNAGLNRRLFRSGTTLKTVHSGYMREGRNLLVSEDSVDLRGCLALEHDNVNRGAERNEAARRYRRERSERWVPVT
jgi:hypothetical protein